MVAAEAAAGRDAARQARAARILHLLADLPAQLSSGRSLPATAADIRREIARLTHLAIQGDHDDEDPHPPGPHADDWRALAGQFTHAGSEAGHVRPRLLQQYRDQHAPAPEGHLAKASPPGLYAVHLLNCAPCRRAETRGSPDASCPIHTLCALAEGVWPVPDPRAPPPPAVSLPYTRPPDDMPPGDPEWAAAALNDLVARGCGQWLTDAQVRDPSECLAVAPVWVATDHKRPVPASCLTDGIEGPINTPDIAARAATAGRAEADAFLAAARGATPDTSAGRRTLHEAWSATAGDAAVSKRRLVERLDTTANLTVSPLGVTFPRACDVLAAAAATDRLMADDAEMAYRSMPIRPELAAITCVQCPSTLRVFRFARLPFGYSQSCAAYCSFTALLKEALSGCDALAGGVEGCPDPLPDIEEINTLRPRYTSAILASMRERRIFTSGVVDDILGRHPAEIEADVFALRGALFRCTGYTRSMKKHRAGTAIVMLGLWCAVRGPGGRPSASLTAAKLYQTMLDLAKWVHIGTRGGAVPIREHEALLGDLGWAAQADPGVALYLPGPRAAFWIAKRQHHLYIRVGAAPCGPPLVSLLERALSGRARATSVAPLDELLAHLTLSATPHPAGAQVTARPHGTSSRSYAMDASVADGLVKWARVTTHPNGSTSVVSGQRPALPKESSTNAELDALADASRHFAEIDGGTVVCIFDSCAAQQAIARCKARWGTAHFTALTTILEAADRHAVSIIPIWVPRTANALADAYT